MTSTSPLSSLGSLKHLDVTQTETVRFIKEDKNMECVQCHQMAIMSWQLMCGHRICDKHLKSSDPFTCNSCNITMEKESVIPDLSGRREVLQAEIFCPNQSEGCEDVIRLGQIDDHLLHCKYVIKPCKNEGCSEKISDAKMNHHLEHECQHEQIPCEHCKESFKRRDIMDHEENTCPSVTVECTNNCGAKAMLRSEMPHHEQNCPKRPQRCPFHKAGCTFQGISSEMQIHEQQYATSHISLTTKAMYTMEQHLQEEIGSLKSQLAEKMTDLRSKKLTKEEHDALKKGQQNNKKAIQDLKLLLVSYGEKNIVLGRQMEDMVSKQIVQELDSEINGLKTKTQELAEKLAVAERASGGSQTNGLNQEQSRRYEQQIALFDTRLSELDLKFQLMETACYEGKLMWKVRDYSRRKAEAISGRNVSLFSQPFYSSRHGYKMCGRIYLNGDGFGKGTHLSYFFVMMKGEYDAILQWPFKAKVSMMLLCQDGTNQNICDVFEPDPRSNSFQKPKTDMNVASGIPEFISHRKLETPKYLKDDTIFLMIKVDCSGLPTL